jgi:hypothetical protein
VTERAALEDRYRSTFARMKEAQDRSAAADAAQRQARDARRAAEEAWDLARDELLGSWPEKPTTTGPLPEGGYRVTLPDGREVAAPAVAWAPGEPCFCPQRFRGEHVAECRRGEPRRLPAPRPEPHKKAKKAPAPAVARGGGGGELPW